MQPYLITYEEAHTLARKMSVHMENDKIDIFIREAEDMDVKPVIGDSLLLAVKATPSRFQTLLDGGRYVDGSGKGKSLAGLKSALSYFVYARFVRNNDGNVTRIGFVNNNSDHSTRALDAERERAYNDAVAIGRRYLQECMEFVHCDEVCRDCCGITEVKRGKYKVLGD